MSIVGSLFQYTTHEGLAKELGVEKQWQSGNSCADGNTGKVIARVEHSNVTMSAKPCVAVRLDGSGRVVLIAEEGVAYKTETD